MRASKSYRSQITKLADLFPCSSLQWDACEQMVQITNHTANRPSSMQFPAVRCLRADATNHYSHSLETYFHAVPCSASGCYRSLVTQLEEIIPCSSLQCDACEEMLQITIHTASRSSSMQFPEMQCGASRCYKLLIIQLTDQVPCSSLHFDACEQMLQITNHTGKRPSSI
jgi:hypothetical protein